MQDRRNIVNTIEDALGREGSKELAERLFDLLRADGRISYDDYHGLVLADDVDLLEEAVKLDAE